MWKFSNLTDPTQFHLQPKIHPCTCLSGLSTGYCAVFNYGEMESVTCHLCTPQNQKGEKSFRNAYFPCVDPYA